jgi:hypothetical protein
VKTCSGTPCEDDAFHAGGNLRETRVW